MPIRTEIPGYPGTVGVLDRLLGVVLVAYSRTRRTLRLRRRRRQVLLRLSYSIMIGDIQCSSVWRDQCSFRHVTILPIK
eukprot:1489238-Rhodomonas_salina.1